ncbi:hypothetical protein FB451DRAFT_1179147 [Mycena latifolia]|nr:hypothetical protein FB451DRAFT_1179147 [Mycena latifolia]
MLKSLTPNSTIEMICVRLSGHHRVEIIQQFQEPIIAVPLPVSRRVEVEVDIAERREPVDIMGRDLAQIHERADLVHARCILTPRETANQFSDIAPSQFLKLLPQWTSSNSGYCAREVAGQDLGNKVVGCRTCTIMGIFTLGHGSAFSMCLWDEDEIKKLPEKLHLGEPDLRPLLDGIALGRADISSGTPQPNRRGPDVFSSNSARNPPFAGKTLRARR